ncbi:MAG: MFS transporter [Sphingomonadales bacterium]|nr:MFS transporter [Sphingomonadales bacterium]
MHANADANAEAGELRCHGLLLLPCLGGIMLVAFHGYSLGVLIHPLEQEFGWSRAAISAGNMIIAVISLLLAPFVGLAVDRFGPRRVALAGTTGYVAMLALVSTAGPDIRGWWLRWALLGLASVTILPTVWTTAINRAFHRHRGKALAFALLGTGLSAAIMPPLTSWLYGAYGWRGAYRGIAGLACLILMLVALLFRDGAATSGKAALAAPLPGLTTGEGLRSAAFIKLAIAVFLFAITCLALTVNAVPVLESRGLSRPAAAGIAGLLGIGSILGRIGGGFLLDRFPAHKVAALAVLMPALAVGLLLAPGGTALAGFAMLLFGLALGTEVDACAYIAARHFGLRSYGALFGVIIGVTTFGSGLAPMLANAVYDHTHSYDPVLWGSMPLCALASLLFASLGTAPDHQPALALAA